MEYYQMTIDEWLGMKQKLQAELLGVRRSFVRIGFMLRKIDEVKGYENDGYKSIAEWAKGEYGLESSTVSRFMAINREYSIGGFSEELLPEYEDFKRSQLEEMLKLPAEDRNMITPDTPRADIRELKAFNKQKVEGVADDIEEFLEKFIEDNWELAVEMEGVSGDPERTREAMIPSGNKSYRKGLFFLMANENKVSIKKYGGQPEEYTWQQFTQILSDIFEERNRREDEERKQAEKIAEERENDGYCKADRDITGSENRTEEAGNEEHDTGNGEAAGGEPAGTITEDRDPAGEMEEGAGTAESTVVEQDMERQKEGNEVIAPAQTSVKEEPENEQKSDESVIEEQENVIGTSGNVTEFPINDPENTDFNPETEEETVTDCHELEVKQQEKTMTRYEYIQDLTEAGLASYLFHNVLKTALTVKDMKNWLHQTVDEKGKTYK